MDPLEKENLVRKALPIAWILWGALLGSLVIYLVVAYVISQQTPPESDLPADSLQKPLLYVLALLGAGLIVLSHFVRRLLLRPKTGPAPAAQPGPGPIVTPFPGQHPLVGKYLAALLVSLALCEAIGIFGLVLFFLGRDMMTLYVFIAVSAAAMVYHRPKEEELSEFLTQATGG
ncbi:MAG: hypothetical protein AB1896_19385 [Thermodesulfobacteriota bacterium]